MTPRKIYNETRNYKNVLVKTGEAMEKERVTIKDIAEKAGVSIGAVHCALNGKRGVSEETRSRILEIARKYDYRPNTAAASLKRKTVRIAAVIPGMTEDNQYYFTYFWAGFRNYLETMKDFKIEVCEVPYYSGTGRLAEELEDLYERQELDGLLCAVSYMDSRSRLALQRFTEKDVSVVLIGEDIPELLKVCCVQPNYDVIGRTIMELLTRQIREGGEILVCAGDVMIPPHYKVILGMDAYLESHGLKNPVHKIHYNDKKDCYRQIVRNLEKNPGLSACFSVTARESVILGTALKDTGRAGTVAAVGSDMFEENLAFLREGTFTNLLNKNPYSQGYMGMKYLVEKLIRGIRPPEETVYVGSEIVFQSSLPMYESNGYNRLLL